MGTATSSDWRRTSLTSEAGEEIDVETVSEEERRALATEEIGTIEDIVEAISKLPVDTKARRLVEELSDQAATGFSHAMVFTQFTDTMDFLRTTSPRQPAVQRYASRVGREKCVAPTGAGQRSPVRR